MTPRLSAYVSTETVGRDDVPTATLKREIA
jgi:hypothetical protein